MNKANGKSMQQWNKRLVLAIARENGALSQVDIIRKSGLSAGTVVNITRQLRKEKFLKPTGKGESSGGRRPVILKFNASAKYIISTLCLHNETRIALVDLTGVIIERVSFPTQPEAGPNAFIQNFRQHTERLLKPKSISLSQVMSFCVSFEGMVDARSGTLIYSARLGWHDVPFKDYFQNLFGANIYIENEGRTSVLGEFIFGAGKSVRNLVYVVLESGIGVSIIHEGRIFHGPHQLEGEIGHTVKDPSGPVCRCGKHGCLEALASGSAIIAAARDEAVPGLEEIINGKPEAEAFNHVLHMAEQGHAAARKILKKAAQLIGASLADVINLLDTEMVILAGYMAENNSPYFLDVIREAANSRCLDNPKRKVSIVRDALGHNAAIIGGALLACQDTFALPDWK